MNILFLRGFNNYFNRKVKLYSTLNDYRTNSSSYIDYSNINFNPNDGVATELVIGGPTQLEGNNILAWDTIGSPDYAICYDNNTIISRWFVIETNRTRNGQYSVGLKRDTIADNYNKVMDAPCFIEKGIINDSSNSLIFNNENMTYNQIKTEISGNIFDKDNFGDVILMDESKSAWVVGYIPRDADPGTITSSVPYTGSEDYTVNGLTSWDFYDYTQNTYKYHVPNSISTMWFAELTYEGTWGQTFTTEFKGQFNWNRDSDNTLTNIETIGSIPASYQNPQYREMSGDQLLSYSNTVRKFIFDDYFTTMLKTVSDNWAFSNAKFITMREYNACINMNNKVLLDSSNGKYYKIKIRLGDTVNGIQTAQGTMNPSINYSIPVSFANWWTNYSIDYTSWNNKTAQTGDDVNYGTWPYCPPDEQYTSQRIWIELEEMSTSIQVVVPAPSLRYHLHDQPYDMFCIPYNPVPIYKNGNLICTASPNAAVRLAVDLAAKAGSGNVYDVQLLPYCPIRSIVDTDEGVIDYGDLFAANITDTTTSAILNVMFWCSSSEFSFDINKSIEIDKALVNNTTLQFNSRKLIDTVDSFDALGSNRYEYYYTIPESEFIDMGVPIESLGTINIKNIILENLILNRGLLHPANIILSALKEPEGWQIRIQCYTKEDLTAIINIELIADIELEYLAENRALSLKLSNETDLYRLCSPNWAGYFDFSVAKMGGVCSGFNVDCSYKPYQPYIHISPIFTGLYGKDFNDARGLICGGDFSLPQLNNAWANYQLNNKNYQAIFDRQMQNLDINNKYQQENDIFGAITGGIGSTVSGAASGAMVGGIPGAIVGGVLGAAGGTVGGILDVNRNANLRKENKQLQVDLYNYNLGNIKALPTSLTKVSAYNNNNKIFPILEYYTCTPKEKEILKNKIKYDGMTIMEISTLSKYNNGYIKGRLIRLDDLNDDSHVADDIYAEVSRGLYLGG